MLNALCVCDHTRDAHDPTSGRCNDQVTSADDPEYGPYQCTCPAFEREPSYVR